MLDGKQWEKIRLVDPNIDLFQEIAPRCAQLIQDMEADIRKPSERLELDSLLEQRREENTSLAQIEFKVKYEEFIEDNEKDFKERQRKAKLQAEPSF